MTKNKTEKTVVSTEQDVPTDVQEVVTSDFTVQDPTVMRPKELPLVITPNSGSWKNENQAKYAQTLNAYAYKNPEKWATKKGKLLAQLAEVGENASAYFKYASHDSRVNFVNKLIQN